MKSDILNIKGVEILSKQSQKEVLGRIGGGGSCNLSLCGCDCTGSVTGPLCCYAHINCLHVITC